MVTLKDLLVPPALSHQDTPSQRLLPALLSPHSTKADLSTSHPASRISSARGWRKVDVKGWQGHRRMLGASQRLGNPFVCQRSCGRSDPLLGPCLDRKLKPASRSSCSSSSKAACLRRAVAGMVSWKHLNCLPPPCSPGSAGESSGPQCAAA